MIAFASLSGFTLHYSSTHYGGRFDFFYFATVVSWLLVIALFLIFALRLTDRLYEKCGNINWNLLVSHPLLSMHVQSFIYKPGCTMLFLVSSHRADIVECATTTFQLSRSDIRPGSSSLVAPVR